MRWANSHSSEAPANTRIGSAPSAATKVSRAVSERAGRAAEESPARATCAELSDSDWVIADHVAEAAPGLDEVGPELLAQAIDQHFDHVGILVEVLIVDVLGQLGLGDDGVRAVHQVREQPVLQRGQRDRLAAPR